MCRTRNVSAMDLSRPVSRAIGTGRSRTLIFALPDRTADQPVLSFERPRLPGNKSHFYHASDSDRIRSYVRAVGEGIEMGFFDKAKCLVGSHDWSTWTYVSESSCTRKRYCKRSGCSKTETDTNHNWPKYEYVTEGDCTKNHTCTRCSEIESIVEHEDWSDWTYVKDSYCDQIRTCPRCNEDETRVEHIWGVWEYEAPNSCDQVRYCRRCDTGKQHKLATHLDHRWAGEDRISCSEMRNECERCQATHPRYGEFHRFTPWETHRDTGRKWRVCVDCDEEERGW